MIARAVTRVLRGANGLLGEANHLLGRLLDDRTLEVFSLEITTSKRATERAHNAFIIGTEVGARSGPQTAPRPAEVHHLRAVQ